MKAHLAAAALGALALTSLALAACQKTDDQTMDTASAAAVEDAAGDAIDPNGRPATLNVQAAVALPSQAPAVAAPGHTLGDANAATLDVPAANNTAN